MPAGHLPDLTTCQQDNFRQEIISDRRRCQPNTVYVADGRPCRQDTLPTGHLANKTIVDRIQLPTGRRASRIPCRLYVADRKPCRLNTLPTGHLADRTQMPTGQRDSRTPYRLETSPTGPIADLANWTACRQDTLPPGYLAPPLPPDPLPTGHPADSVGRFFFVDYTGPDLTIPDLNYLYRN